MDGPSNGGGQMEHNRREQALTRAQELSSVQPFPHNNRGIHRCQRSQTTSAMKRLVLLF